MDGFENAVIEQQQAVIEQQQGVIEQQQQHIQELKGMMAGISRYCGTPAPCRYCGCADYPVCPRCYEERE
jgi:hypothetical protein